MPFVRAAGRCSAHIPCVPNRTGGLSATKDQDFPELRIVKKNCARAHFIQLFDVDKFVLFAEDDLIQARVLAAVCRNIGLPISNYVIVSNGAEAMEYFKRSKTAGSGIRTPDLVITDLKMPEIDGLELLKWIRATPPFNQTRVILLTAALDQKIKSVAEQLGCDSFIEKPVGLAQIAQTVQSILDDLENPP
jgi:CheY-like chemotaxis protein